MPERRRGPRPRATMGDMRKGLTLIEIVVVVAIIAFLMGVYFVAANPAGQLAGARNNRRKSDIETLSINIKRMVADTGNEQFSCSAGTLPTSSPKIMGIGAGNYDIAQCLIPTYLPNLPFDPSASTSYYNSPSDYNTGYSILQNASGSITIAAPYAELGAKITITQ